jgi:DNA-binding beta-propeller fold protein YncE
MMTPRLSRRRLVPWSFAVAAVIGSCNLHNPGLDQPDDALSYPNALALSLGERPDFLYVANTNFDIRYNSASVQSYGLEALEGALRAGNCRSVQRYAGWDGGVRSVADNTRYQAAALDAGVLDAGDRGAPVSPDDAGLSDDAGALPAAGDGGFDAGSALDAGAGAIAVPDEFVVSELGNPRGTICDGVFDPSAPDCCFDTPEERNMLRLGQFKIDSFAQGIGVSPNGKRVYVPVASRNTLVYLDVDDKGGFSCGDATETCRRGPRIKGNDDDPQDSFPGSLSSMGIGKLSDLITPGSAAPSNPNATYVATTHELGGFGLFIDNGATVDSAQAGEPVLESVGRNLPDRPRSVVADPSKKLLYVASANVSAISRLSVRVDPDPDLANGEVREPGPRELVYQTIPITVNGLAQSSDARDLAVDPKDPSRLYVLVRGTQQSIAFLQLDRTAVGTGARLIDAVRIGEGPSRLLYITVGDHPFLLVSCYDAKEIYIIDPATRRLVTVVRSFSGPFEMAYDGARKLLHVTDFRASVLRVVDLAGLVDKTQPPPRVIATIGTPRFKGAI